MPFQYCCDVGDFDGDEAAIRAMCARDLEIMDAFFPGCGAIGEPKDTIEAAEAVGMEHNRDNPGHEGYYPAVGSRLQYYCRHGPNLVTDAPKLQELIYRGYQEGSDEIIRHFPGCGPVGGVFETFDEASDVGQDHNFGHPHHGGHVADVDD